MQELDIQILDILARPMRMDELRRALRGVRKKDMEESLERLTAEGKIMRNKKNRIAQIAHFVVPAVPILPQNADLVLWHPMSKMSRVIFSSRQTA